MKASILLALLFSSTLAHAETKTLQANPALAKPLLQFLESHDEFAAGMGQGIMAYAAELECSNKQGDTDNLVAMTCYLRSAGSFSLTPVSPRIVPIQLSGALKDLMARDKDTFSVPVSQGIFVLSAHVRCYDNAGVGDNSPNTCELSNQ